MTFNTESALGYQSEYCLSVLWGFQSISNMKMYDYPFTYFWTLFLAYSMPVLLLYWMKKRVPRRRVHS